MGNEGGGREAAPRAVPAAQASARGTGNGGGGISREPVRVVAARGAEWLRGGLAGSVGRWRRAEQ